MAEKVDRFESTLTKLAGKIVESNASVTQNRRDAVRPVFAFESRHDLRSKRYVHLRAGPNARSNVIFVSFKRIVHFSFPFREPFCA